jgi:hypothetical protein
MAEVERLKTLPLLDEEIAARLGMLRKMIPPAVGWTKSHLALP